MFVTLSYSSPILSIHARSKWSNSDNEFVPCATSFHYSVSFKYCAVHIVSGVTRTTKIVPCTTSFHYSVGFTYCAVHIVSGVIRTTSLYHALLPSTTVSVCFLFFSNLALRIILICILFTVVLLIGRYGCFVRCTS